MEILLQLIVGQQLENALFSLLFFLLESLY